MIGARDLAFPQAEPAELVHLHGRRACSTIGVAVIGGVDTGWTFYAPFSSMFSNTYVIPAAVGIFITGFSSILTGLNFMVTIHTMRAPGLTWGRLPLFVWAHVRHQPGDGPGHAGAGDHDPPGGGGAAPRGRHLRPGAGGRPDPLPAPLLVLLAPGRLHHDPAGLRRHQRDHPLLLAAADLRLPVHGRGDPDHLGARLPRLGPSHVRQRPVDVRRDGLLDPQLPRGRSRPAIKVFNWTATMYKGRVRFDTPMLYALGFIGLFVDRRADRADAGVAGPRRARARHVLRRRALPLHHGGRVGHGLPGGHPLLVAQDERARCTRSSGASWRR